MVCIATIAVHDAPARERMGLRRALLTRRANLGNCSNARAVLRHVASPASLRYPYCVVPLPRRSRGQCSASDLALQVSKQALDRAAGTQAADVHTLVFVHDAPDERIGHSVPARVQCELGLRGALPFSISQAHNTAWLIALDLAVGLIEGPEDARAVLLVAADKLVFGTPPHVATALVWADVAAAAVVTRDAATGWRVRQVQVGHFDTPVRAHQRWPEADRVAFAAYAAGMIDTVLASNGQPASGLAAVVTTSPDAAFADAVHAAARLPAAAVRMGCGQTLRPRHAASADAPVGLARIASKVSPGVPVLVWAQGDNGEFACALLERIA